MSNLFNASQKTRYYLNFNNGNKEHLNSLNGMYRIEMDIIVPFQNEKNSFTSKTINKINFYVDQDNLPQYSFDTNIEDGFKTLLLNSLEENFNKLKFVKIAKITPESYYTPLADNNTRKIYQNGVFNNISLKFRVYDEHYLQITTNEKLTQPLDVLSYLSICIFPRESGGSIYESIRAILSGLSSTVISNRSQNDANVGDESLLQNLARALIDNLSGTTENGNTNYFEPLLKKLKERAFGCPTVKITRLGDRELKYNAMQFFVTNFNATFSKDMIMNNESKQLLPTYIDFEITLSPILIPSFDTIKEWLFNDVVSKDERAKLELAFRQNNPGNMVDLNKKFDEQMKIIEKSREREGSNTLRKVIKIG